jgi:hypothetical protein
MSQLVAALLCVLCATSFAAAQSKPDRLRTIWENHIHHSNNRERHDILLLSSILRTMERRKSLFTSPAEGGVELEAVSC